MLSQGSSATYEGSTDLSTGDEQNYSDFEVDSSDHLEGDEQGLARPYSRELSGFYADLEDHTSEDEELLLLDQEGQDDPLNYPRREYNLKETIRQDSSGENSSQSDIESPLLSSASSKKRRPTSTSKMSSRGDPTSTSVAPAGPDTQTGQSGDGNNVPMVLRAAEVEPVGVFWDIENCSIPKGKSAFAVAQKIRNEFFEEKREAEFICVCDTMKENGDVIDGLNDAQVRTYVYEYT